MKNMWLMCPLGELDPNMHLSRGVKTSLSVLVPICQPLIDVCVGAHWP